MHQIQSGTIKKHPDFKKVLDSQAVTVFDCDNGSGIISVNKAYDEILGKAKRYGIAMGVGCHNANIGCGSYYGWRAASDNLVAFLCCNTYPFTSSYGGADCLIGTNPIIFSAPAGEECPIVMDISTTCVAMGKIQAMEREGKPIPAEWAKDYDGKPTTDPSKAFSLAPISGHKGYGLAVMVDMLSTMFSSACYGSDIGQFSTLEKENTGFCLILIDPSAFMPIDEFKTEVDRYVRMMKNGRKAPGVNEIFLPGEIEFRKFDEMKKSGLKVSEALEKEMAEAAISLGVAKEGMSFADLIESFQNDCQ